MGLEAKLKSIAVFDFDGTMIKYDSMVLLFRKYFKFSFRNIKNFFLLLYESIKFFLRIISQKTYKERFINIILRSLKLKSSDLEKVNLEFSKFVAGHILKDAIKELNRLKNHGYETILLSASPDFFLQEIKKMLGFSNLICTQTAIKDNRLVITGENCYGKNKIKRLLEKYPESQVDWKNSYCFSDNLSDCRLLSLFGNAYAVNNKKLKIKNQDFRFLDWK